jgi:hypothetical protein
MLDLLAFFTCRCFICYLLRQPYDNNLINSATFFGGNKHLEIKYLLRRWYAVFGSGSRFNTAAGSGIGFGIQIGIQRGETGLRERLFYKFIFAWLDVSLLCEGINT